MMTEVKNGVLYIDGVSVPEIAKQFGTPCYIMSEDTVRKNCRKYMDAAEKYYGKNALPLYASKAFSCVDIYKTVASEGFGADVVSGGELYTALKAGFDPKKIYFHGNAKTADEIKFALESGVGRIVADNIEELDRIDGIAKELNVKADISFRIKPGVEAHTHNFVKTGQIDSKFGFALENGEAFRAVKSAAEKKNINIAGVHCHIGSQIFDIAPFVLAAKIMLGFIAKVKNELSIEIKELNLGGGFGIRYVEGDNPEPYEDYMQKIADTVKSESEALGITVPFILVEPGRSIVAEAGITAYTVMSVKTIENIRTYVAIDGGMTDNPRYALYGSKYEACVANKAGDPCDFTATIAGRCCESGDLIGENMKIQKPEAGDILTVFSTGAYNYSMASNYNRVPRPPVIMIKNGEPKIIVKRETYEDIIKNDTI
ncbi:MAG: diaminopimelate decarboxylase [Clostridia bacterium]|nr:diaminopimelate decarboxylase [Clostridia bacterium]MBQ6172008.1 diaminopimelate decarboxylase [Clostridia bacterium]